MRRNIIPFGYLLFFILISTPVFPQENSKILLFNGGDIETRLSVSSSLFWGMGGKSANLGGSISSFDPDGSIAFWNPARLSLLKKRTLQLDYNPSLHFDLASFTDLDAEIQSSTDKAIQDYRDESLVPIYSRIGAKFSQQNQISSAVLAFPFRNLVFATYFHRQVNLNFNSLASGIRTQLSTKLEEDDVFFNSFIGGNFSLQLGVNSVGIAASKVINSQWAVGMAVERFDVLLRANGQLNIEGTMLSGGKENIFNDPNDSWYNDLNQSIDAHYAGADLGWKIAGSYNFNKNLYFDAVLEWNPNVTASGSINLLNNAVPAINFNHEDGSEIIDPSKLKLSQLTLTKKVDNKVYPQVKLKLPRTLKIGGAFRTSRVNMHLNYGLAFSPVSFVYGKDEIGLKPTHTLRLGFDFKYVQTAMGFSVLKKVAKGSENLGEEGDAIFLPLFSLGSGMDFLNAYRVDFLIFAVPMPLLKVSLGYNF